MRSIGKCQNSFFIKYEMRAHELTEKILITDYRQHILRILQSKVEAWHVMAEQGDDNLKWVMLEDLNEMFVGMNIRFDFDYFDGSAFTAGEIDPTTGRIKIVFDPRALSGGTVNFLESPELFIKGITKSMTHELLHREQLYKSRVGLEPGDPDLNHSAYLALPHEIQAYGKDAADELLAMYGTKQKVIQTIRKNGWKNISFDSDTMRGYMDTFHEDPDDPASRVWKQFLKYFYFYLDE